MRLNSMWLVLPPCLVAPFADRELVDNMNESSLATGPRRGHAALVGGGRKEANFLAEIALVNTPSLMSTNMCSQKVLRQKRRGKPQL